MARHTSTALATLLAGILVALATPPPARAVSFKCEASAVRGTVLALPPIEPLVANRGQDACKAASATLADVPAALPAPLSGAAAVAQTSLQGPPDKVDQQQAGAVGGLADLRIKALPDLPIQLPTGTVPTVPPISIPALPLLIPAGITADVNPAIKALLPNGKLPNLDLVHVQAAVAYANAACQGGRPQLTGTSQVAGLNVLGVDLPGDQAVDQTLKLIDSASVDPSNIDLSKVQFSGPLDLTNPAVLAVVQAAVQPVVDALPSIQIPATLAQVKVTPGGQERTTDRLAQQALRVQVSIAGQNVADLVLGEAIVSSAGVTCPPPSVTASDLALQCTTRKLVLIDVLEHGRRVKLLGAADRRYVGRRVGIVFSATGKQVASAVVRADGSFQTTAPLPAPSLRGTNRARYQAVLGGERSLRLKLRRRMVVDSLSSADGQVTIVGRVVKPLAAPVKPITVVRRISCTQSEVVEQIVPRADGRFRVTVAAPPGQQAAVYRLATLVRKTPRNPKLFPTFTLPRAVALE